MALNACAAAAVGLAAGIESEKIERGLENYVSVGMRMRLETAGTIRIINDAYNANPLSMKAALTTLAAQSTPYKVAFLGDMLEMGPAEESGHQEVLVYALDLNLPIGLVGPRFQEAWNKLRSRYPSAQIVCQTEQSDQVLESWNPINEPTTILLKGSRGMKMECISIHLQERFQ